MRARADIYLPSRKNNKKTVVYFLVFFSIVVHGLSIPLLNAAYWYFDVQPVHEDADMDGDGDRDRDVDMDVDVPRLDAVDGGERS